MNRRNALVLAAGTVLFGGTAWGKPAERPWLQYSEIAELFEKFSSLPAEQRKNLVFLVKAAAMDDSLAPSDIALTLGSKKGRVDIPVDSRGVIAFPLQAALREEDPTIFITTTTLTKVAVIIDVLINVPQQPTFKYADMMVWVKNAADGIRKHAGVWAFFMPKPDGLELEYAAGQSATARATPDGQTRVWSTNPKGKLVVPLNDDLLSENPDIVVSAPPQQARPHFKVKMQLVPSNEANLK